MNRDSGACESKLKGLTCVTGVIERDSAMQKICLKIQKLKISQIQKALRFQQHKWLPTKPVGIVGTARDSVGAVADESSPALRSFYTGKGRNTSQME